MISPFSIITYSNIFKSYRNTLIHILFIPIILFTGYGIAQNFETTAGSLTYQIDEQNKIDFSYILIWNTLIGVAYLMTDMLTGFITYAAVIAIVLIAQCMNDLEKDEKLFGGYLFTGFVVLHVIAWLSQFAGHFIYERKYQIFLNSFSSFTDHLFLFIQKEHQP